MILDVALEIAEQGDDPLGPLLQREGDAFEDVVDEVAEHVGVGLRQTEHLGDHPHGDGLGILGRAVDNIPASECLNEFPAVGAGAGLVRCFCNPPARFSPNFWE